MKRFSLILPLLFLVLLCGCGSEKDVPEAMPRIPQTRKAMYSGHLPRRFPTRWRMRPL